MIRVALLVSLTMCWGAVAAEDTVGEKLAKARATHETKVKSARDQVLNMLQKREEEATRKGDKKIVDRVLAERESFLNEGVFPTIIDVKVLKLASLDAQTAFEKELKAAVSGFTKAKMAAEATEAEEELEKLRKAAAEVKLKETFSAGSVLAGTRKNENSKGAGMPISLNVEMRKSGTITGKLTIGEPPRTYDFTGSISDDQVKVTITPKEGDNFRQTFTGTMKLSKIEFKYEGISSSASNTPATANRGTGELARDAKKSKP